MEVGEEELKKQESARLQHQGRKQKFASKRKGEENDGQIIETEASQLPTPLCYGAMEGNITVNGLLWLFHFQAARHRKKHHVDRLQCA